MTRLSQWASLMVGLDPDYLEERWVVVNGVVLVSIEMWDLID